MVQPNVSISPAMGELFQLKAITHPFQRLPARRARFPDQPLDEDHRAPESITGVERACYQ